MLEMILPVSLGFKVTPKGITSKSRSFDWGSSRFAVIALIITGIGIIKGFTEFRVFAIEKDAYFFNLGWAIYNFTLLFMSLLVAWEKPQRRKEERLDFKFPVEFVTHDGIYTTTTKDISISGLSFVNESKNIIPPRGRLKLFGADSLELDYEVVYNKLPWYKGKRYAVKYLNVTQDQRKRLIVKLFTEPENWNEVHSVHTRSNLVIGYHFIVSLFRAFLPETAGVKGSDNGKS